MKNQTKIAAQALTKENIDTEEKFRYVYTKDDFELNTPRSLYRDRLFQAVAFARRYKFKVGVLSIDLDTFKNDDPSASEIDEKIQEIIAKRIVNALRETDTVSSQGVDEFVVILPDLGEDENIHIVANKILATISEPMKIAGKEIILEPFIGLSIYPNDTENPDELATLANISVLFGKENGEVITHLKQKH